MTIHDDFSYCISKLHNSNLLNCTGAIANVLRCSAENKELCNYIAKNAENVSLYDELISLSTSKKFPTNPKVCIPFVYTILHLIDTSRLSAEDVVCKVFPKKDIDIAYTLFFTALSDALLNSLEVMDSEEQSMDTENTNNSLLFNEFYSAIEETPEVKCSSILGKMLEELLRALETQDVSLVKSYYYGIESIIRSNSINPNSMNCIRKYLSEFGIEV